jgi:Pin2-interacting protein X1
LSQDPNNTHWSKSTATYGHKILSAQGWKPGDYLGAEDASHSDHYTDANASHIRVFLREENLGLGAQVGKVNAETFGLSLFSGVLGRLNGKSDAEVQKHQNALRDAELRTYQAQKYGRMNFVSGGFLVGDRIESSRGGETWPERHKESVISEAKIVQDASKKRASQPGTTEPIGKKRKKIGTKKRLDIEGSDESQLSQDAAEDMTSVRAKTKKQKRSKANQKTSTGDEDANEEDERSRQKQERRARKEERRRRKEEKRKSASSDETPKAKSTRDRSDAKKTGTKQNAETFAGNRHAVRQRYIQQKRMASLDPQAMKEIFMLKPTATAA